MNKLNRWRVEEKMPEKGIFFGLIRVKREIDRTETRKRIFEFNMASILKLFSCLFISCMWDNKFFEGASSGKPKMVYALKME